MSRWQDYPANRYRLCCKPMGQLFCSLLATLVGIIVEAEIDGAWPVTELAELVGVEMRAQRAGHVREACLAQRGIVEQSLDNNHLGAVPNLLPCIQTALGSGQEAMSESRAMLRP